MITSLDCPSSQPVSNSNRRTFLKRGFLTLRGLALPSLMPFRGIGAVAATSTARSAIASTNGKSVIFVFLAGGPSHLDMYDMKPEAPADIRGEFRAIATNVYGIRMCEHLPLHAKIADKLAIVNGVETIDTHNAAVVMTGYTADLRRRRIEEIGAVRVQTPSLPHGDWDTHGRVLGRQLSIFQELRDKLPAYDRAIYSLINNVYDRGLDKDVLIVACGEFGRTPWINKYCGRDHWAPCGSVLFAGGGLRMGQVIGDTGPIGERERLRSQPYTAHSVLATIYRHLNISPSTLIQADDGREMPRLEDAQSIAELI